MELRPWQGCVPTPRRAVLAVCVSVLIGSMTLTQATADGAPAQPTTAAESAHVTYVSGDSVYIDAGTVRGIHKGDILTLIRDGETIATLWVQVLSSTRTVAILVGEPAEILIGDDVRWAALDAGDSSMSRSSDVEGEHIRISHIDETSIYLDAGKNRDLRTGEQLRVLRDGAFVAVIQVTDVTRDGATAITISNPGLLEPGDLVRDPVRTATDFRPRTITPEPAAAKRPRASRRDRIVRGRVGIRFVQFSDELTANTGFSQPALSLRTDANGVGGGRLDLSVDARARRTYRSSATGPGDQDNQTRVYRLTAAIHDKRSRQVLAVGRQFSPAVATISVFDGILLGLNRKHVSTGIFTGSQPDPIDYGYDTTIRESGGYLQFHNQPDAVRRWSMTTGLVGSYQDGEINREFAYFQLLANGRRGSIYLSQELDYNRDWKLVAGENPYSLTSRYVNIGYRIGKGFSFRVGHDDRRNVRLYRDLITPETEFDDSFRTGTWIGFTQRIKKRFRFGIDAKQTDGENTESVGTYTLNLGVNRITSKNLSIVYRGTRYVNSISEGNLHALNMSVSVARWARLALTGGLREDFDLVDPTMDDEVVWYGFDADFNVGRQWFIQVSSERTVGRSEATIQSYLGMTYRF